MSKLKGGKQSVVLLEYFVEISKSRQPADRGMYASAVHREGRAGDITLGVIISRWY